MLYQPEILSANIVVLGAFNPAIFSPDWLEQNQLIGPDDAKVIRSSENFVVTRQITQLQSESFRLLVEENKCQVNCIGVAGPHIRDLTMGVLELLPHTPLRALGLNFDIQYRFLNSDAYHKIGDVLVPKSIWQKVVDDPDRAIGLEQLRILVQDGKRGEELKSSDSKTISVQRGGSDLTIRISYNDHHEFASLPEGTEAAEVAIGVLKEQWHEQLQAASQTFNRVIELAIAES
ncbi:MAG: hypothetical protein Q8L44_09630 [Sulfuritalea sp.]|nr:hypothetical protein [Sulfuritalea sp.]